MYSDNNNAIVVDKLSKVYRVAGKKERFWHRSRYKPFVALDSVSLTVQKGELVGVIGRNGAGKSTLLKVLTRITPPSEGGAELYGRVGSLLEVGTGFHPELTGRENIYLNGSILGMRRSEIRAQFDAIVAFAGVERFLDTPVKRYSSGMYVRLAFAVAAHLRSEILLVDEVLAVGDVEFQRHCLGKIKEVAGSGRTVMFVSHHLEAISALCDRVVVLQAGKISYDGDVVGGINSYLNSFAKGSTSTALPESRSGSGEIRVLSVEPSKGFYDASEVKCFDVILRRMDVIEYPFFISAHIVDARGNVISQCDSRLVGKWFVLGEDMRVGLQIGAPWLKPGVYTLDVYICASGIMDRCEGACGFEVTPRLPYLFSASPDATANGVVFADFRYEVK
ncbi:MAG: ABC transporter ATP-binding protein [Verrucomicrobiota bacterium]